MMQKVMPSLLVVFSTIIIVASAHAADIYENPTNLKVLPKDISPAELRDTMKNFALSTGLRCSSCHMGEEGQPLDVYDFVSDEKILKDKARAMLKLVQKTNTQLKNDFGDLHEAVDCVTCHRGVPEPKTLGKVLVEAAKANGVEGLQLRYAELRKKYYGTHSYDFSEVTLSELAQERMQAGKVDQAYAVLNILLKDNPMSFQGHFMYAELASMQGDNELAKKHYKKVIEINPKAATFIQAKLEQLGLDQSETP